MNPDNTRLDELLGAYALNAVDDTGRSAFAMQLDVR